MRNFQSYYYIFNRYGFSAIWCKLQQLYLAFGKVAASSVMLGVASEAAFDVLFGAVKHSIADLKKLQDDISTKKRFDAMKNEILQIKSNYRTILQKRMLLKKQAVNLLANYIIHLESMIL